MKLAALGQMQILVTPLTGNPEILNVEIIAENRKEKLSMVTNKDETADQFASRLKSMLRSMLNGEAREDINKEDAVKPLTWEEQKTALKEKKVKHEA